jgi:hypothetical protein
LLADIRPIHLPPTSKWVLDYADNSCRLSRVFGDAKQQTTLTFESVAPGSFDMMVVGWPTESNSDQIPMRFAPPQFEKTEGRPVRTKGGVPGILWSNMLLVPDELRQEIRIRRERMDFRSRPPPLDLAHEADIKRKQQEFAATTTEIVIETRRNRPIVLDTQSLGDPMKAFAKCGTDSLRDWGVDPELEERIVRPAFPIGLSSWFSSDDYPRAMLNVLAESDVKVRLLVDKEGHVTKCTTLSHFDAPEFERVVCNGISRRAKFHPAELAGGVRVPSYYTTQVNFRIAN